MTERHFFRFHQFIGGHAGLFHFGDDLQDQLLGCVAFLWVDSRVHAEQSRIARRIGKCRHAESEAGFFANPPIQTRAAAFAQNRRKQIERGNIRMRDLGNVPGQ